MCAIQLFLITKDMQENVSIPLENDSFISNDVSFLHFFSSVLNEIIEMELLLLKLEAHSIT